MADILTKSEFAQLRGVDKSAVSHWIRDGKLAGNALVGEGRAAKIRVAEAQRQLGGSLDLGQQLAQGKRPTASSVAPDDEDAIPLAPADDHAARYQKAKADTAVLDAERARRRMAQEVGVYTATEAAKDAWSKELAQLIQAVDQWWPDVAELIQQLASDGKPLEPKRVTVALRRAWRQFRLDRAELARSAAAGLPELVEE